DGSVAEKDGGAGVAVVLFGRRVRFTHAAVGGANQGAFGSGAQGVGGGQQRRGAGAQGIGEVGGADVRAGIEDRGDGGGALLFAVRRRGRGEEQRLELRRRGIRKAIDGGVYRQGQAVLIMIGDGLFTPGRGCPPLLADQLARQAIAGNVAPKADNTDHSDSV